MMLNGSKNKYYMLSDNINYAFFLNIFKCYQSLRISKRWGRKGLFDKKTYFCVSDEGRFCDIF